MAANQWEGQRDFTGSEHFARKSMAAGRGEIVQPDIVVPAVPVRLEPELTSARSRLITAFNDGATTRLPTTAARAQAAFDCWLDEAEARQKPPRLDILTGRARTKRVKHEHGSEAHER